MALIVKPTGLEKIWASGGVKETPADSKITQGHVVELPAYQYVNWLVNKQDTFIAHVNQVGIPVWDAVTEYIGGKSYVQGTNGVVYKALLTNTNVVPSNPLNSSTWVKAFEDFGSVAALTVTVNNLATNYSTLAGIANTAAARNNLSVYSKTESDARFAAVLGNASNTFLVANATNDSHAINRGQFLSLLNQATEPQAGIAAIASQSESDVGTNDTKILTPKKATATFVKRSNNLSDLANVATARNNLGLTSTATTNISDFLLKTGNLSGIANAPAARTNLGLGDIAVRASTDFLDKAGNLAGITWPPTARANLGLGSMATASDADYLSKAGNLAGLTNTATARANLGLGTMSTSNTWDYMAKSENLAGLWNTQAARNNLGLQALAVFNAIGVDAAGVSGNYLNFDLQTDTVSGTIKSPNGLYDQFGTHNMGGRGSVQTVTFPVPMPNRCMNIQMTNIENAKTESAGVPRILSHNRFGFTFWNTNTNTYTSWMWRAIGN